MRPHLPRRLLPPFLAAAVFAATACGGSTPILDSFATATSEPASTSVTQNGQVAGASATPTPEATAGAGRQYVVESGDTLGAIAEEFGVTVDAIVQANDLTDANQIIVGQTLEIPPAAN